MAKKTTREVAAALPIAIIVSLGVLTLGVSFAVILRSAATAAADAAKMTMAAENGVVIETAFIPYPHLHAIALLLIPASIAAIMAPALGRAMTLDAETRKGDIVLAGRTIVAASLVAGWCCAFGIAIPAMTVTETLSRNQMVRCPPLDIDADVSLLPGGPARPKTWIAAAASCPIPSKTPKNAADVRTEFCSGNAGWCEMDTGRARGWRNMTVVDHRDRGGAPATDETKLRRKGPDRDID